MASLRPSVRSLRTSLRSSPPSSRLPSRRHESSNHSTPPPHCQHSSSRDETFGKKFYIILASIPLTFAILKFIRAPSAEGRPPLLERVVESWSQLGGSWKERNTRHTMAIEQAAHDRNLFQSAKRSEKVELRFPEIFNTGSPYNVMAGNGGGDLSSLIKHYEDQNAEEERRRQALEEKRRKEDIG